MYESHFHLQQPPFSIAPDPEFLYLSEGHREALAHLTYGLNHGGFVLITGEVGTGKTTLLRNLLNQMPADVEVAFILNPRLTVRELLETLCDELRIAYPRNERSSIKHYIDALNGHLLETHASGRSTVVIIDEAQNLTPSVLEQIRLLTNLETDKRKLLRIILLGQPELLELLARKELRQLGQRITARYHLRGLGHDDTFAYVTHRLKRAGGSADIFTRPALQRLYRISGGIPRLINLIADRAMLGAYAQGRHRIRWSMVGRAAREVLGPRVNHRARLGAGVAIASLAVLALGYLLFADSLRQSVGRPGLATGAADLAPAPQVAEQVAEPATPPDPTGALTNGDADVPAAGAEAAATELATIASVATDPGSALPDSAAPDSTLADSMEPDTTSGRVARPGVATNTSPPPLPDAMPVTERAPARQTLERPALGTYQTQRLAFQAAFARWGIDFSAESAATIPCDFAPTAGLQCLSGTGTWTDLRRFNLPAIIELWDDETTPFYGVMTAMDGDRIDLHIAGTDYQLHIQDLGRNWFGAYVLLWRMPPDYSGSIKQGDRHPSVGWVRRQLEQMGFAAAGNSDANGFDANLRDAVIRFQESESMLADGIVGPQTWIRLSQRLEQPQPRLEG